MAGEQKGYAYPRKNLREGGDKELVERGSTQMMVVGGREVTDHLIDHRPLKGTSFARWLISSHATDIDGRVCQPARASTTDPIPS